MIYFGTSKTLRKNGFYFTKRLLLVDYRTKIPNYWVSFTFNHVNYYVGYNRLKRIIRDKLYELDGKKIRYHYKK